VYAGRRATPEKTGFARRGAGLDAGRWRALAGPPKPQKKPFKKIKKTLVIFRDL
jgi:hypothetical protein